MLWIRYQCQSICPRQVHSNYTVYLKCIFKHDTSWTNFESVESVSSCLFCLFPVCLWQISAVGRDTIDHSDAQLHPGGIAGLSCALSLLRNHVTEGGVPSPSVALVEWQEQLGGRLHTCKVCRGWWSWIMMNHVPRASFEMKSLPKPSIELCLWVMNPCHDAMDVATTTYDEHMQPRFTFLGGKCTVLLHPWQRRAGGWLGSWCRCSLGPWYWQQSTDWRWLDTIRGQDTNWYKLFEHDGWFMVDFVSCNGLHVAYQSKVCTSTQGFHRFPISISTQLVKVGFKSKLSVSHHKWIKKFGWLPLVPCWQRMPFPSISKFCQSSLQSKDLVHSSAQNIWLHGPAATDSCNFQLSKARGGRNSDVGCWADVRDSLGMACSIGVVTCPIQNCRFGTGLLEGNCTQSCCRMTRSGSIVWPLLAKQHLSVKRAARWRRHQKIRTNFVEHKFEEGIESSWQHSWFKAIPLQKPVQTILNFMFALLL